MANNFPIPPVVFPPARNRGGHGGPQERRLHMPPFQPARHQNPTIPFVAFDFGNAAAAAPPPFSVGFEDEPPLLEELGIDTRQIWRKTISVLNPFRVNAHLHEDPDLSGPFLLLMAFGLFQSIPGKFLFGILLGWSTVASLFLYVVFNMLAGKHGDLNVHRCMSLIGYSMLPMVMLSAANEVAALFLPRGGVAVFVMAGIFVAWSARVCSRLVVGISFGGEEHIGLIFYACFLIYALFSLLIIF